MTSEEMKKEYPDQKQRAAICMQSSRSEADKFDFQKMFEEELVYSEYQKECECGEVEELTESNFVVPEDSDYEDFGEETEEVSADGLWDNILKKKEREGKKYKPAKKGDPDRPDPESFKKAQSGSYYVYEDPVTGEVFTYKRQGVYRKNGRTLIYRGVIGRHEAKAAEYQGRKVQLNKPFRTPDGPKKRSVYVKNQKGNVVKVNFGDPNMKIKKNDPARRRNFRARHRCDTPGPKWKARYWSCKAW